MRWEIDQKKIGIMVGYTIFQSGSFASIRFIFNHCLHIWLLIVCFCCCSRTWEFCLLRSTWIGNELELSKLLLKIIVFFLFHSCIRLLMFYVVFILVLYQPTCTTDKMMIKNGLLQEMCVVCHITGTCIINERGWGEQFLPDNLNRTPGKFANKVVTT